MKAWSQCLLLFSMVANAQSSGDQVAVARLNADLMALKSLPALSDGADLAAANESPGQNEVMARFATDLNQQTRFLYAKGVVNRNLAYGLTSVLAGKNLSHETLTPLTTAILGVIDSAFACRLDSSDLAQSASFRASIEQAYNALIALDVSTANTQAVMRLLYQAARPVAHPLVQPISPLLPPLYRPNR